MFNQLIHDADDLEVGDRITMDGLKICEVVDTNATLGTSEGFEIRGVTDDEDDTAFKTALQLRTRWRRVDE
jgi:hypothetical protein